MYSYDKIKTKIKHKYIAQTHSLHYAGPPISRGFHSCGNQIMPNLQHFLVINYN